MAADYGRDDTQTVGRSAPKVQWGAAKPAKPRTPVYHHDPRTRPGFTNYSSEAPDDIADNPAGNLAGSAEKQLQQYEQSKAADAYRSGTHESSWGGGSVMGGLAQGQNVQSQNAGSRQLKNSTVNWGNVAGLGSWLGNPNDPGYAQKAAYLKGMGIMPTYNGMGLDTAQRASQIQGMSQMGGSGSPYLGGMDGRAGTPSAGANGYLSQQHQNWVNDFTRQNTDGGGNVMLQNAGGVFLDSTGSAYTGMSGGQQYENGRLVSGGADGGRAPNSAARMQAAYGGAGGAGGIGAMGGGGGPGGDDYGAGGAYRNLIAAGGSVLTPQQAAAMRNRATDPIARGANDAIQQARIDAIRRGDDSGSSLGSREDAIRRQSANDQSMAGLNFDTGLRRENVSNLLSAAGGASGLYGTNLQNIAKLRELEMLMAQMQAEGGGMGGGLQYVLGGG